MEFLILMGLLIEYSSKSHLLDDQMLHGTLKEILDPTHAFYSRYYGFKVRMQRILIETLSLLSSPYLCIRYASDSRS
jgi:hypothetical protein